ncbi:MAG: formate dehydrogenase subunit gamma [Candidatus Brocadiia bacterium]
MIHRRAVHTWSLAALLAALAAPGGARAEEAEPDHEEHYAHRIPLKAADGTVLGPQSTVPYSPRQTCSGAECHSYEAITQGMHFDMGKSRLADDWGAERQEPWALSPGMVGGFLPTFLRQYAKKENESAAEIDMTAYEFVQACGACHPGGGAMEYDRDGQRFDRRQKAHPEVAQSLDGDYHGAKWDRSGVVEVDCLMCHAQWPYDNAERTAQLRAQNYQYAATAAAGFGGVEGRVADTEEPGGVAVRYHPRWFDSEGRVAMDIDRPQDHSCLFCHHFPALEGGSGWEHRQWRDIHTAQGLACVDCHAGEEDHNFNLGRKLHWSVRDTDAQPMTCERCHGEGHLGSPPARHPGFPRFHFQKIACVTCHSGPALPVAGRGIEHVFTDTSSSTPEAAGFQPEAGAAGGRWTPVPRPDPQAPWQIVYEPRGGQLRVHNSQLPVWWGNFLDDDTLWPLFPSEVGAVFKRERGEEGTERLVLVADGQVVGEITDHMGDGVAEVNRHEEAVAAMTALGKSLEGGRFEHVKPGFVRGRHVHWVETGDDKSGEEFDQTQSLNIAIAHVVRPPQEALGAGGCGDCHSLESYIFWGRRVVEPYNNQDEVNDKSMRRWLGFETARMRLGFFREKVLRPYGLWLVPLAVVLCLAHYVVFGPKRVRGDDADDEVRRFSLFERATHLVQMLAFLVLAVTGAGFILSALWRDGLSHLWRSPTTESVHEVAGYAFLAASLVLVVRWAPNCIFRAYDFRWFDVMGGYLWRKGEAPAGKFNAGQKLLFWLTAAAVAAMGVSGVLMALRPASLNHWMPYAYTLHILTAVLLLPLIVGHVYLATICNPGTLRSIFEGRVTRRWAATHHPNWLEETGEGR